MSHNESLQQDFTVGALRFPLPYPMSEREAMKAGMAIMLVSAVPMIGLFALGMHLFHNLAGALLPPLLWAVVFGRVLMPVAYKHMADKTDVAQLHDQYVEQVHKNRDRRKARRAQEQDGSFLVTRVSVGPLEISTPYPMPPERAEVVALRHVVLSFASALGLYALVMTLTGEVEWTLVAVLAWLGLWALVTGLVRRRTADTPQAVAAREQYVAQRDEEEHAVQREAHRREQEREIRDEAERKIQRLREEDQR